MAFQVCPQHSFEEVHGVWISDEVGTEFVCHRIDHVVPGPFSWINSPPPPPGTDLSGIAEELGLGVEIPAVLHQFVGTWIEYGVFERAYALANPKDWAFLIDRYGHTALAPKRYTVSAFLAATLGNLDRAGVVKYHSGPATGHWSYNGTISYWSLLPTPDWENRLSWADSGQPVDYVPGKATD
ncbi:hypothetical protein ACOACQ_19100 [Nocardioides sp. CPCC 206347]|uniref:hypothetical protein n=1 Tax=unclassified Nocardioides TaxID=2615069 RepID=UPI00360C3D67